MEKKEKVQMAWHISTFRNQKPWQRHSSKICMPVDCDTAVSMSVQQPTASILASLICPNYGQ